jgi:hypothetical protein
MLYTINQGNVETVKEGQRHIVHLVLNAEDLANDQEYVFTDGHAIMDISNFYGDLADLSRLDWNSIRSLKWGAYYDPTEETKRKKQSEFLAHRHVPWSQVVGIGVASQDCADLALSSLDGVEPVPPIAIMPGWYY